MASTSTSSLMKKARTYGVYTALMLGAVGGCHAVVDVVGPGPDIAGTVAPLMQDSEMVAAKATDFVMTYLAARSGQESRLREFVSAKNIELPAHPIPATDPIVHIAKPVGTQGGFKLWTVVVSVSQNDVASGTFARIYYRVPMGIVSGRPRALDMPAVVAPPETGFDAPQDYETKLADTDLIARTAEGFLQAYTAGKGDIRSYQTADTIDKPIDPAPFRDLKVTGVYATGLNGSTQPSENSDSVSASVKVTAIGYTQNYSTVTLSYFLKFTYEGKRWLVEGIDPVPSLKTDTDPSEATESVTADVPTTSSAIPAPVAK